MEFAKCPEPERAGLTETANTLFAGISSGSLNVDQYLGSILAASHFLRKEFQPTRGEKVFALGFCMGGSLSGLLACHDPELSGAAIFYGNAPAPELLSNIQCPVVGFYGSLDKRLADGVPAFTEAMQKAGKHFESHIYPGVQHAFFNDTRPSYDVAAARQAFASVLKFFSP